MAACQGARPASAPREAKTHVREAGETLSGQDKTQRCQYMSKNKDMDTFHVSRRPHVGEATPRPQGNRRSPSLMFQSIWIIHHPCQPPIAIPGYSVLPGESRDWWIHLTPLCDGQMLPKKPSQARPAGVWAWLGPAWAYWAAPMSWQQSVRSCLGPPNLLAAVCGDLPLVLSNVVTFGPVLLRLCSVV